MSEAKHVILPGATLGVMGGGQLGRMFVHAAQSMGYRTAVLDAWRPFDRSGETAPRPGLSRALPIIDLLDDDVDLAPARHLPPPAAAGSVAGGLCPFRARLLPGHPPTLRRTAT